MRDGQWLLQMHWNASVKKLTWTMNAKGPWPGKPCSVKPWMNKASLILCGKTEVLTTLLIWHQKRVDSIMIIGVFHTANFSQ